MSELDLLPRTPMMSSTPPAKLRKLPRPLMDLLRRSTRPRLLCCRWLRRETTIRALRCARAALHESRQPLRRECRDKVSHRPQRWSTMNPERRSIERSHLRTPIVLTEGMGGRLGYSWRPTMPWALWLALTVQIAGRFRLVHETLLNWNVRYESTEYGLLTIPVGGLASMRLRAFAYFSFAMIQLKGVIYGVLVFSVSTDVLLPYVTSYVVISIG